MNISIGLDSVCRSNKGHVYNEVESEGLRQVRVWMRVSTNVRFSETKVRLRMSITVWVSVWVKVRKRDIVGFRVCVMFTTRVTGEADSG